jgi:hypothetical protein
MISVCEKSATRVMAAGFYFKFQCERRFLFSATPSQQSVAETVYNSEKHGSTGSARAKGKFDADYQYHQEVSLDARPSSVTCK